MKRNAIAALLVVACGAGAFAVGSQSASPAIQSIDVVETDCDDGSYESATELRRADGGTKVVLEDVYVGPSPNHSLDAELTASSGNYTLTLTPTDTDDSGRTCTGELHYRAVVFIPAETFDLSVVHGDETHTVLDNDESSSSAASGSVAPGSASGSDSSAANATATTASNSVRGNG